MSGAFQNSEFKNGEENINSHRIPVVNEFRLPPLTDRNNTNIKNFDSSRISPNLQSTLRQESSETNAYMLLKIEDIGLVVESINDDSDQLKLYFGCKALKSILMVCT